MPTLRVNITPEVLIWACSRSKREQNEVVKKFPYYDAWLDETKQPTLKQLEEFAKFTRTSTGFLLLSTPPVIKIPIPDLRTIRDTKVSQPTPDLLDTIFICQERQEWYKTFALAQKEESLSFVGSLSAVPIVQAAEDIRNVLNYSLDDQKSSSTWEEALKKLIECADKAGILVMASGVVGSNTHRKLDTNEFRGFCLADDIAPLVFINAADSKSAQMFTLVHELAHVWRGETGVSNTEVTNESDKNIEQWCNKVAAEFLVPAKSIREEYNPAQTFTHSVDHLSRLFKVSRLVIIRRLHDISVISREKMWEEYRTEEKRLADIIRSSGGEFYRTLRTRIGERFQYALVESTLAGQTLYRDAARLMGFKNLQTFDRIVERIGA